MSKKANNSKKQKIAFKNRLTWEKGDIQVINSNLSTKKIEALEALLRPGSFFNVQSIAKNFLNVFKRCLKRIKNGCKVSFI